MKTKIHITSGFGTLGIWGHYSGNEAQGPGDEIEAHQFHLV